jgi:hypothetical protein
VAFDGTTLFPGYPALAPVIGTTLVIVAGSSAAANHTAAFDGVRSYSSAIGRIRFTWCTGLCVMPQAAVSRVGSLPWWTTAALSGACLPTAGLLHRYVERRFIDGARLAAAPARRVLLVSLLITTFVAASFSDSQLASSQIPLDSGSPASSVTAMAPPVSTPYVPTITDPDLSSAADDAPELYSNDCDLELLGALGGRQGSAG